MCFFGCQFNNLIPVPGNRTQFRIKIISSDLNNFQSVLATVLLTTAENCFYLQYQQLRIKRFYDIVVCSDLIPLFHIFFQTLGCDINERNG